MAAWALSLGRTCPSARKCSEESKAKAATSVRPSHGAPPQSLPHAPPERQGWAKRHTCWIAEQQDACLG